MNAEKTGYSIREGSTILAERRLESEVAEAIIRRHKIQRLARQALELLDEIEMTDYLEVARELGVEVELDRHDPYFVKAMLREILALDPAEIPAAVRAVNDGATVDDRAAYTRSSEGGRADGLARGTGNPSSLDDEVGS
jgi:hypothetical protein